MSVIKELQQKMNTAKKTFAFLGIFAFLILSIGLVSADTIESDDFEDNDLSDWTTTPDTFGNAWVVGTTNPSGGSFYAELDSLVGGNNDDSATMERTFPTAGYKDIIFSYDRQLIELESGDGFNVSYSNDGGITWTVLETNNTANDASYFSKSHTLSDVLSEDNSDFKIKFECNLNADEEFCRVDNVVLVGTLMVYSLDITEPTSSVDYGQNTTLTITNDGDYDLSNLVLNETSSFGATFSDIASLITGASDTITVILDSLTGITFGANTLTIFAQDSVQTDANDTITITIDEHFCDSGETDSNIRNLSIENLDFENNGDGDDNEWEILDEIEVEIDVKNLNDDDEMEDVIVELGLFDSEGNNVADELEFLSGGESNEESNEFDIDEDEEETIKFVFRIPVDFEDGNYKLALKAYSDDLGEDAQCTDSSNDFSNAMNADFYEDITLDRESDREKSIVVDDIEMDYQATCGQTVSGTFTVFNIGDDDEEKVKITMSNSELGLSETFEILNDLDSGDEETISFSFEIPEGIEDKTYSLSFLTYFDYDDGDYDEVSEDSFDKSISVIGCEEQTEESVLVTAEIDSDEVNAGEELVVTSTITNLGDETTTFAIDVTGLGDWAELVSLSDEAITLESGESKEVTITLNVNSEAEGTQTFVIETNSNGNLEVQQVEVSIAEGAGFIGLNLGNNKTLSLFIIVNLILILLIITVAVRLARR